MRSSGSTPGHRFPFAVILLAMPLLTACGGGGSSSATPVAPPASTVTSVTVLPGAPTLQFGQAQQFTATVQGTGNPGSAVTWSAGAGHISASGLYTAPASGSADTVTATSVQNTAISGQAQVNLQAVVNTGLDKTIWGGARESLALKADGSVWDWGLNENGILGIGVQDLTWTAAFAPGVDMKVPTQVLGPGGVGHLTGITRVMGCEHFNFALKSDGTVWSWGWNYRGSLGNGSGTTNQSSSLYPVQVSNLANVVSLGGRGYHGLAAQADGTVWAWGDNQDGELGNGTTVDSDVPVQVTGLANPRMVSGGGFFSLALMQDGTVRSWGANDSGQLGNNTTTGSTVTVQVPGLANIIQVSAGWVHAVALRADGTVWVWGSNNWGGYNGSIYNSCSGMLGDGTTSNSLVPEQVPGLSGIIDVSAGDSFTAVLRSDGTVWTFGGNGVGQCGIGSESQSQLTPVQVPGLSGVIAVNARDHHCLSMKSDGTIWCWGSGTLGELGNNQIQDSDVPVQTAAF